MVTAVALGLLPNANASRHNTWWYIVSGRISLVKDTDKSGRHSRGLRPGGIIDYCAFGLKPILALGGSRRASEVNDTNTIEFIVAHNITGLQPCSNCNISVALSDSEECAKETYSGAKSVPLKDVLTYTADDEGEGSTGLQKAVINANMEHPAVLSFVETIKSEYEDPTSQVVGASVFLTNQDGDLVACAFLKAPTSDEEKETVYNILFGDTEGEEGTSGVDDAAPSTLGDATSPCNHWMTSIIVAIGVAAASTLLLAVNA
jgi:hypothetical protein